MHWSGEWRVNDRVFSFLLWFFRRSASGKRRRNTIPALAFALASAFLIWMGLAALIARVRRDIYLLGLGSIILTKRKSVQAGPRDTHVGRQVRSMGSVFCCTLVLDQRWAEFILSCFPMAVRLVPGSLCVLGPYP